MNVETLKPVVEALLMVADGPLSLDRLAKLLEGEGASAPERDTLRAVLAALQADCAGRGIELAEVASGWRFRARADFAGQVGRLWEERRPRYSRAFLETLAIIASRQPITRGEIEHIRGVAVSSNIMRLLLEREWVKVVGHRDVPGRPSVYATTSEFLDYFGLKSLRELPTLAELKDIDDLNADLFGAAADAAPGSGRRRVGAEQPDAETVPRRGPAGCAGRGRGARIERHCHDRRRRRRTHPRRPWPAPISGSRREIERLIAAGRVRVNGQPITVGHRVNPVIASRSTAVACSASSRQTPTYACSPTKPAGVVCTRSDSKAAPTSSRSCRASNRDGGSTSAGWTSIPAVCCCSRTTANSPTGSCIRVIASTANTRCGCSARSTRPCSNVCARVSRSTASRAISTTSPPARARASINGSTASSSRDATARCAGYGNRRACRSAA